MPLRSQLPNSRLLKMVLLSTALCGRVIADERAPGAPPTLSPSSAPAAAAPLDTELPSLKPGLWEYRRTLGTRGSASPAQAALQKCGDPTADMRSKRVELEKTGCRFSSTVHVGNVYRASWACPSHGGTIAMSQVLNVTSDSSYEDLTEARFEEQRTRTKIVATRVGECPLVPGAPKRRPFTVPRKPAPRADGAAP